MQPKVLPDFTGKWTDRESNPESLPISNCEVFYERPLTHSLNLQLCEGSVIPLDHQPVFCFYFESINYIFYQSHLNRVLI